MIKLNYKILMILSGIIFSVVSCNLGDKPAAEAAELEVLPEDIVELRDDQIKLAGIEFGSVEMRSVSNTIKVNGVVSVAPQNQAKVCMPLGGFIKSTTLFPGNAVSKGQTLAIIENQDFIDIQQSYLEAKNRFVYAEAEYKRHTELYKDDVYSEKNVQQVTVEYKNLKALVKSLEQKLFLIGINPDNLNEDNISNSVSLVSPIKGFLRAVNVNIGQYVSPTDILFEIVNSDKLFLELTLFEKDADTDAMVLVGEIGGDEEERTAAFIQQHIKKPVFAYIVGITAPEGKRMGHAGAIVTAGAGTAGSKIKAFTQAGVPVANTIDELADMVVQSQRK